MQVPDYARDCREILRTDTALKSVAIDAASTGIAVARPRNDSRHALRLAKRQQKQVPKLHKSHACPTRLRILLDAIAPSSIET
jgi:hypothetical protein